MRLGAGARARIVELRRRGLGLGDEIGQRLDAGVRTHHQDIGGVDELRDRDEILERVIGQVLEQRRIDRDRGRGQEQRVAVRRRPRRHAHPGIPCRPGPVVDDDGLAERSTKRGREDAGDDVGRPARRERHDQRDRPLRIGGAGGHRREDREHGGSAAPASDFPKSSMRVLRRSTEASGNSIAPAISIGRSPRSGPSWVNVGPCVTSRLTLRPPGRRGC